MIRATQRMGCNMPEGQSYRSAVEKLRSVYNDLKDKGELERMARARDEVVGRYGRFFQPGGVSDLTEEIFRSFLNFKNNRHWTGLHRQAVPLTKDMDKLREALATLVSPDQPLPERFDRAIGSVKGLGRALASAVLLVSSPGEYGVWNNTSEAALKSLAIWPAFKVGDTLGQKYEKVNHLLLALAGSLSVDLWILDWLFWYVLAPEAPEVVSSDEAYGFSLERHLHDFLWDNWHRTDLAKEWVPYSEEGDDQRGYEYPTSVGRIDILARHKSGKGWLVVELKRDQSNDQTVGQVLRYMGWVKKNLASEGETVQGVIISRDADEALRYALEAVGSDQLRVLRYEVDFHLFPIEIAGVRGDRA